MQLLVTRASKDLGTDLWFDEGPISRERFSPYGNTDDPIPDGGDGDEEESEENGKGM